MVSRYIDNLLAFRILYLLVQPFEKTDAFKLGIIDKDGKLLIPVKDFTSNEQKDAYNYLVRLVFNIKRLMSKVPGGGSILASLVAAYFLIKEGIEEGDLSNLEERYFELNEMLNEGVCLVEEELLVRKFLALIEDGAPANSMGSGGIAVKDNPMTLKKRNNWKDLPKAFGVTSFELTDDAYLGITKAKAKGAKWDKHLPKSDEDLETYNKIKKYSKVYSKNPIVVKRKGHEHYTLIKEPK